MSVAGVAHPVERHLAKVEVASSSLVTRSISADAKASALFLLCSIGSNHSMRQSCGLSLAAGLDGGNTTILIPEEAKCQRASSPAPKTVSFGKRSFIVF